jgi:hypothetical protein
MRWFLSLALLLPACQSIKNLPYPKDAVIARLPIPVRGKSIFKIQSPDQKQTVVVVAPDGYTIEHGHFAPLAPPMGLLVRPGERWGFAGDIPRKQYHAVQMTLDSK